MRYMTLFTLAIIEREVTIQVTFGRDNQATGTSARTFSFIRRRFEMMRVRTYILLRKLPYYLQEMGPLPGSPPQISASRRPDASSICKLVVGTQVLCIYRLVTIHSLSVNKLHQADTYHGQNMKKIPHDAILLQVQGTYCNYAVRVQ